MQIRAMISVQARVRGPRGDALSGWSGLRIQSRMALPVLPEPICLSTRDPRAIESKRGRSAEKWVPLEAKVVEDDLVPDSIVAEMRSLGLFRSLDFAAYGGLE